MEEGVAEGADLEDEMEEDESASDSTVHGTAILFLNLFLSKKVCLQLPKNCWNKLLCLGNGSLVARDAALVRRLAFGGRMTRSTRLLP